jgi:hypothetical protein
MEMDPKTKKKEVYIPLRKSTEIIMKRVKSLDIHLPLARLIRMDLAGEFQDPTLEPLRTYLYKYLKVANQYRKLYFEYLKKTKIVFDREMTKDGSFAPGFKQYDSLKNQLAETLLKKQRKVWIISYDQYLPTIREHSEKHSKDPRSGQEMYDSLNNIFNKDLKEIKRFQLKTLKRTKEFHKELGIALKNPEVIWGEWHEPGAERTG